MIRLHFHPSFNPIKVLLMLEETGLDHEIVPVDPFKGEQHDPAFTGIAPNAKVPVSREGVVQLQARLRRRNHARIVSRKLRCLMLRGPFGGIAVVAEAAGWAITQAAAPSAVAGFRDFRDRVFAANAGPARRTAAFEYQDKWPLRAA